MKLIKYKTFKEMNEAKIRRWSQMTLEEKLKASFYPIMSENDEIFIFHVVIKSLNVGTLTFKDKKWTFQYSEEFKSQNEILPIFQFSNKNREYASKTLWPFFLKRIPSVNNPDVSELIKKKNIDPKNKAEMLANFGRRISDNRFLVELHQKGATK